jgi:hypothetical protein
LTSPIVLVRGNRSRRALPRGGFTSSSDIDARPASEQLYNFIHTSAASA